MIATWTRFMDAGDAPAEEWASMGVEPGDGLRIGDADVQSSSHETWLITSEARHRLPIVSVCNASSAAKLSPFEPDAQRKARFLLNNERVGLILNSDYELVKFLKIPAVIPTSLRYFAEDLFVGIGKSGKEVVSFTMGKGESEFIVGNYAIGAMVHGYRGIKCDSQGVYVLHEGGVKTLKPLAA